jgi:hypothetical protein
MAYLLNVLVHHGYSSRLLGTHPTTIHYTPPRFILKDHRRYRASQLRMLHTRRCGTPWVLPMGGPCTGGGRGISHRGRTNEEVLFFYIKVEWSVLCGCRGCRIVWCVACGVGWPYTSDGPLK